MGIDSSIGFLIPRSNGLDLNAVYTEVDAMAGLNQKSHFMADGVDIISERRWLFFMRKVKMNTCKRITRSDASFNAMARKQLCNKGFISLWLLPESINKSMLDGHSESENSSLWTPEDVSIESPSGTCEIDLGEECGSFDACKVYFWGYGYFHPHTLDVAVSIIAKSDTFRRLHDSLMAVLPKSIPRVTPCEGESGRVTYLQDFQLPVFASQSF